ncbi:MBL fold metallo-hydrolase [Vibrio spartinae]|uniref:Rieske 2Fe-2S iron-sulfur protein n=1 Tax=Vibrio spartinae TaxID=1918945 RepID=A0A1N6M2V3_9VIBR|nr:MBL fold metallo-hydrolase [Vibrio spartinae]QMV12912.1 Putative Rieske 2Fe-2S iron-sulfur protein [Vibrio spartinae]SIO93764.1 Putative Rieske 2Fe-2S iron-sulfur protein/MSMEI_6242 [Vibrio spartinae]
MMRRENFLETEGEVFFYLRDNVVIEPLVEHWYAWHYLLSPVARSFFMRKNRKQLRSFLKYPEFHSGISSGKVGTVRLSVDDVLSVKQYLDSTQQLESQQEQLVAAVEKLDDLVFQFRGDSLEPLYQEIPFELKGRTELFYARNQSGSYRLFENAFEGIFDRCESVLFTLKTEYTKRPPVFNTPRLTCYESQFLIDIDFKDKILDKIFESRQAPIDFNKLCQEMNLTDEEKQKFRKFFTSEYREKALSEPDGGKIRYFGHATLLIETSSESLLIDPWIQNESFEKDGKNSYSLSDLPTHIDYVVITHGHADHFNIETLLQIRHKVGQIIVPKSSGDMIEDPSLAKILKQIGFGNVVEVDPFEKIHGSTFQLHTIPFLGEHGDLRVDAKSSYYIETDSEQLLILSDSKFIQEEIYQYLFKHSLKVSKMFVGMECEGAPYTWLYEPILNQGYQPEYAKNRRLIGCNGNETEQLIQLINPDSVFVYAMGLEPWLEYLTGKPATFDDYIVREYKHLEEKMFQEDRSIKLLYWSEEISI